MSAACVFGVSHGYRIFCLIATLWRIMQTLDRILEITRKAWQFDAPAQSVSPAMETTAGGRAEALGMLSYIMSTEILSRNGERVQEA